MKNSPSLEFDDSNGAAFFSGYGADNGRRWLTFREQLKVAEVDQQQLIQAACETFQTPEQWLTL